MIGMESLFSNSGGKIQDRRYGSMEVCKYALHGGRKCGDGWDWWEFFFKSRC